MNTKLILVINCGSSSLKFALYTTKTIKPNNNTDNQTTLLAEGLAESLNSSSGSLAITYFNTAKNSDTDQKTSFKTKDHADAISLIISELQKIFDLNANLSGVGHRIVHGGDKFKQSAVITEQVIAEIEHCIPLAPLHNPANLLGINILLSQFPTITQVAVFDTSFHQSMPEKAFIYAIPYDFYQKEGVRRYGFHGTSHRFVSLTVAKLLEKDTHNINLITAHLGNGASVTAIRNGESVDTSMGMTPLEGLVMGTRSGDIDPGLFDFLISKNISPEKISIILNKESGLLGISGISNDMRTLCEHAAQGHERSILAVDIFCFRLAKYIAAMMISLSEFDALVFTGGIGENSALVRNKTVAQLAILGFSLDKNKNENDPKNTSIHSYESKAILVIQTDEEIMIVNDTLQLLPGIL